MSDQQSALAPQPVTGVNGADETGTGFGLPPELEQDPALERFWVALKRVPKYLKLAANMARDNEVPGPAKALLAAGGVYTVSPIDLVPGIIPVAGQLDDLIVLLLTIRTAIRACPPEVAARHLERAGITASSFDEDLAAAKDTAWWVAAKGYRASKRMVQRGSRGLSKLWQGTIRPALSDVRR